MSKNSKNSEVRIDNLYFYGNNPRKVRWLNVSRLPQYIENHPFEINSDNYHFSFDKKGMLHGKCFYIDDDIDLQIIVDRSVIKSLILNGKQII